MVAFKDVYQLICLINCHWNHLYNLAVVLALIQPRLTSMRNLTQKIHAGA